MSTQTQLATKVALAADSISNIPTIDDAKEFVTSRLAQLGIYGEDDYEILMSGDCTEGDARCVFCEDEPPQIPVPRFKRLWRILKEGGKKEDTMTIGDLESPNGITVENPSGMIFVKPVGQWKDEELLAEYGIDTHQDILDTLSKRVHGRAFIIFSDEANSVVDMKNTLHVLRLARRQDTPKTYPTENGVRRLWHVGDFPSVMQTACPLHKGTVLFDGYCDSCGKSWTGVGDELMQFARLVANSGEGPEKPKEIKAFIEDLKTDDWDTLGSDYPAAFSDMEEHKINGTSLPNLRIRVSSPCTAKGFDPVNPVNNKNRKF